MGWSLVIHRRPRGGEGRSDGEFLVDLEKFRRLLAARPGSCRQGRRLPQSATDPVSFPVVGDCRAQDTVVPHREQAPFRQDFLSVPIGLWPVGAGRFLEAFGTVREATRALAAKGRPGTLRCGHWLPKGVRKPGHNPECSAGRLRRRPGRGAREEAGGRAPGSRRFCFLKAFGSKAAGAGARPAVASALFVCFWTVGVGRFLEAFGTHREPSAAR